MKKHHIERIVLFVSLITILGGCAGCAGCAGNEIPSTPTPAITATVAPTEKPVKISPTEVPATPIAVPDPTLEPTATPASTCTPVPTVVVAPEAKLIDSIKMGDNVWYDFYDGGTLVVRGTGKTRDVDAEFKTVYEPQHTILVQINEDEYNNVILKYTPKVIAIVVEEGVEELGAWSLSGFFFTEKVFLPTSLKVLGASALFKTIDENVEIAGLRTEMSFGKYSLGSTFANVTPEFAECTEAPIPKPLPTATPLPDPDKPKKYATKQMGDNVNFEFWDNGYLYVKGTGATWDKNYVTFLDFRTEPYCNTHTVIIEDGITYLGTSIFNELNKVSYYSLPKTLTTISSNTGGYSGNEKTIIEGFYDGKAVTLKIEGTGNPGQFYSIIENAKLYEEYYPGMFEVIFK